MTDRTYSLYRLFLTIKDKKYTKKENVTNSNKQPVDKYAFSSKGPHIVGALNSQKSTENYISQLNV